MCDIVASHINKIRDTSIDLRDTFQDLEFLPNQQ